MYVCWGIYHTELLSLSPYHVAYVTVRVTTNLKWWSFYLAVFGTGLRAKWEQIMFFAFGVRCSAFKTSRPVDRYRRTRTEYARSGVIILGGGGKDCINVDVNVG